MRRRTRDTALIAGMVMAVLLLHLMYFSPRFARDMHQLQAFALDVFTTVVRIVYQVVADAYSSVM